MTFNDMPKEIFIPATIGGIYAAYKSRNLTEYEAGPWGVFPSKIIIGLAGVGVGAMVGVMGAPALITVGATIAFEELKLSRREKK